MYQIGKIDLPVDLNWSIIKLVDIIINTLCVSVSQCVFLWTHN